MPSPTFQTIRLTRGRHQSPAEGACVMELASMLADEPFSDHPRSVCPVIAMILRAYNDGVDDDLRQDLYGYAAAAVGTRDRRARRRRLQRCEELFGSARTLLPRSRLRALGRAALAYGQTADAAAHERFLRLVDELLADEVPAVVSGSNAAARAQLHAAPRV